MILYVIGNGFDIHHQCNSGYKCYRAWLEVNEPETFELLETIYGNPDYNWWNDFEQHLTVVKNDYFNMIAGMSFGDKLHRLHSIHHNTSAIDEFEHNGGDIYDNLKLNKVIVEFEVTELIRRIKDSFHDWINTLSPANLDNKIEIVDKNHIIFLNFNYTTTLEDKYGIDPEMVTHIHGKKGGSDYIIGHGSQFEDMLLRDLENGEYPDFPDDMSETLSQEELSSEAKSNMYSALENIKKDIDYVKEIHKDFFNSLEGVNQVIFRGFSYSPVDLPYIDYIFEIIGRDVQIDASWHTPTDKNRLEDYFRDFPNIIKTEF